MHGAEHGVVFARPGELQSRPQKLVAESGTGGASVLACQRLLPGESLGALHRLGVLFSAQSLRLVFSEFCIQSTRGEIVIHDDWLTSAFFNFVLLGPFDHFDLFDFEASLRDSIVIFLSAEALMPILQDPELLNSEQALR